MNNVNEITFCIEGYNNGKEINLVAQLKKDNTFSEKSRTVIPSGYFKKYIPLKFYNSFFIDDIELRFRFIGLNTDLYIFDNYIKYSSNNFAKCNGIGRMVFPASYWIDALLRL